MKLYRYALSITSQFYFCGIPFRLDSTPKCPLNCIYCFAMARGGRRTSTSLVASPNHIRGKFDRVYGKNNKALDVVGDFISQKIPLHFGGMSDPFANEMVSHISSELLDVLAEHSYPTVLSTKQSNELKKPLILNKLKNLGKVVIQVSLPTLDEKLAAVLEPSAPPPVDRLKTLALLANEGFHIIVRLQPLLPNQIRMVIQELIPRLGEAGVKHVVVEFLKLPVEKTISNISDLFNDLGWDGMAYFQSHHAMRTGREWVLPPAFKWELLQPLISSIHRYGMTYGAGDYGLNHLGDTDCCCGISELSGFENWYKNNIPYIVRKNEEKEIRYKQVEASSGKSIRMYLNSHCRYKDSNTFTDYLKSKWNRPGTDNAPDSFLGVDFSGEYDNQMNCVYIRKEI